MPWSRSCSSRSARWRSTVATSVSRTCGTAWSRRTSSFPPAEAMSPEEKAEIGEFAGAEGRHRRRGRGVLPLHRRTPRGHQRRDDLLGDQLRRHAKRGSTPSTAAELQGKADTLFKGESLRAMLLNAYGWWTVATIALWAGIAMVARGSAARDPLDPRLPSRGEGVGDHHEGAPGQRARSTPTQHARASGLSSGPLHGRSPPAGGLLLLAHCRHCQRCAPHRRRQLKWPPLP